jgi:hypothetical protein
LAQNTLAIQHRLLQAKHGFGQKSTCNTAYMIASKTWIWPKIHLQYSIDDCKQNMDLAQNQLAIQHRLLQAKHGFGPKSTCNLL